MNKPQCPKCGTELDEEFGMVTCPGCGSVLFIDFEGQAQLADDASTNLGEAKGPATQTQAPLAPPAETPSNDLPLSDYNEDIGAENPAAMTYGEPAFGEPAFDNSPPEQTEAPAPAAALDDASIESFSNYESMAPMAGEIAVEPSADGVFEAREPMPSAPTPPPRSSQNEAESDALDISAYANSEASQAKEGPLTYTVHIEGLDSKELRESLREALSESRFAWDPQGLMATIKEGKLTLKSVEPVKASVLVNRLKRLPLKIWWEQNVVTESNP